jgi:hypothetical protein
MSGSNFRLGNLADWQPLDGCADFEVSDAPATVSLQLIAGEPVKLYVTEAGGGMQLVGGGIGNVRLRFTASGDFKLEAVGAGEASMPEVWIKGRREPQIIPASNDPSFTTIEPRPSGPGADLRRFMHMQRLNSQRREQLLRDELARMGELVATAYRQPPAAPAAAPTPPTAPAAPEAAANAPAAGPA